MGRVQSAGYFQYYDPTSQAALVRGADISSAQGNTPNFATMYGAGARFVYFKMGGYTYTFPTGRYIRVSATGNSSGSSVILREINVYGYNPLANGGLGGDVWLAAGKTVTTSKTPDSGTAAQLTDGITSSASDVNIGTGYQWATVDLGNAATYTLKAFLINTYTGVFWKDFKVEISADNATWTTVFYQAGTGTWKDKVVGSGSAGLSFTCATHSLYTNSGQVTSSNVAAARAAGLKVGFYWFKNPSYFDRTAGVFQWNNTTTDATNEAGLFKGMIDTALATTGDYGDVMPMLDWENNYGNIYPSVTDDQAYDFISTFCDTFKAATKRQVITYTAFYTNEVLDTTPTQLVHSTKGAIALKTPLWLASTAASQTSYNLTAFGGWAGWTIWQYSSDGNGKGSTYGVSSGDIDLDYIEDINEIAKPVTASGFGATLGDAQVVLNWTASTNTQFLKYNIYRDGGTTPIATISNKATTTYTDTGLNNGQTYAYTITVSTSWEESALSGSQGATPAPAYTILFPYFPHYKRDETIDGNWTFNHAIKVGVNNVLTAGDVGAGGLALATRAYADAETNVIQASINTHTARTDNPHATDATQIHDANAHTNIGSAINDPQSTINSAINTALGTKQNSITAKTAFNQDFEASTANIKMDGAVSVGALSTIARADHIHASDTSKANVAGNDTVTGSWTLQNGVYIQNKSFGFNNQASPIMYMRVMRVKFTNTFTRFYMEMPMFCSGSNVRTGTLKAYLYESTTVGTIDAGSFVNVINDSGSTKAFASGDVLYQQWKTAGSNPDYIDIWIKVDAFAKFNMNIHFMYIEGTAYTLNPDSATTANGVGLQSAVPAAAATATYGSDSVTAQAAINATIKTITMT